MPCFHPWKAYRLAPPGRGITLNPRLSYVGSKPITLPCGQCIGCRMDKSQDWATRIHHEASLHERNCFVTLTFNADNYPWDGSVSVRDIQGFMKRLRFHLEPTRVRFFACGEYGDQNGRPHYHLILFGWSPEDATPWRRTGSGFVVSRSAFLERIWPLGHVEVGHVSLQTAGYVARYCLKKVTGDRASDHYTRPHEQTGEFHTVRPEFICMSNRPGIGHGWQAKYREGDCFPKDFLVIDGRKRPVPAYYLRKKKELEDETKLLNSSDLIKLKRKQRAALHKDNNTPSRLSTREEVLARRAGQLKREI